MMQPGWIILTCRAGRVIARKPNDVGVDAVADGDTGNSCAGLQAFLSDVGLNGFR